MCDYETSRNLLFIAFGVVNVRHFDMQIREETATGSFVNIENLLCRTLNAPMNAHNCRNADTSDMDLSQIKANFACPSG